MEYRVRFIAQKDIGELVNLYHLARTALVGKPCAPYDRMLWASASFAKSHNISATATYKDLCGLLGR